MARRHKVHARAAVKPSIPSPVLTPEGRADNWVNATNGLGTLVDPLANASVVPIRHQLQDARLLETLYYEDDLCASIVDKVVDASLRQGIELERRASIDDGMEEADPEESKRQSDAILRRLRELQATQLISEADKFGRLFGGACLYIGLADGAPELPVSLQRARPVVYLSVMDRTELIPVRKYEDPKDPRYGTVEVYRYQPGSGGGGFEVHESRLLRFDGISVSRRERDRQAGWSLSVLTRVFEVVRDGQQNWRSVSLILNQAHQAVFKLKNLVSMIANGHSAELQNRMAVTNMARSISRAVIVDADTESFEYHNASLGGLDVILDKTWQRIAAAAGMPVTVLMGTSPAGMNATGESDTRQWYDTVQAHRTDILGPQVERLVHIIAAEQGDPTPTEWQAKWPSLWQMDPQTEATCRKVVCDMDVAYINAGVLTPEEVAASRFAGGWTAETTVDFELREQAALAEQQRQTMQAQAYPQGEQAPPDGAVAAETGEAIAEGEAPEVEPA